MFPRSWISFGVLHGMAVMLLLVRADRRVGDVLAGGRLGDDEAVEDHRAALHDIAANDRNAVTAFIEDYVRRNFKARPIKGVRVWQEKEAY